MNSQIDIQYADFQNVKDIECLENQLQEDRYTYSMIEASLKDDTYFNLIALLDGKCVGYVSLKNVLDESELLKIVVDGKIRRCGVATRLLQFAINALKEIGIKFIHLEVRSNNYSAISLYEKIGFKISGERKNYYNNCDAKLYVYEV